MPLTALYLAGALFGQEAAPPPATEVEVARLERCVLKEDDPSRCGEFDKAVAALASCLGPPPKDGAREAAFDRWARCTRVEPCGWREPRPDESALAIRYCAVRGVAVRKILAARWNPQAEAWRTLDERRVMASMEALLTAEPPTPEEGGDLARWSGGWWLVWDSWLQTLWFERARLAAGG